MMIYIDTSLAAGKKSVIMLIVIPISKPPAMAPSKLPIPPTMTTTNAGIRSAVAGRGVESELRGSEHAGEAREQQAQREFTM